MTAHGDNSGPAYPEMKDSSDADRILPLVYDELRRLARARLAHEPAGQTLQPTGLVHEAYLRLANEKDAKWQNKGHFFAAAAVAMRRILIERARRKRTRKAADANRPVTELESGQDIDSIDLLALDAALTKLAAFDRRLAEVVHLRFFAGLSVEQTAEIMHVGERTVKRDWNFARAWLREQMEQSR